MPSMAMAKPSAQMIHFQILSLPLSYQQKPLITPAGTIRGELLNGHITDLRIFSSSASYLAILACGLLFFCLLFFSLFLVVVSLSAGNYCICDIWQKILLSLRRRYTYYPPWIIFFLISYLMHQSSYSGNSIRLIVTVSYCDQFVTNWGQNRSKMVIRDETIKSRKSAPVLDLHDFSRSCGKSLLVQPLRHLSIGWIV